MVDKLREGKLLEEAVTNVYLTWLKYEDSRLKSLQQSRQNSEKKFAAGEASTGTLERQKSHNFIDHGSSSRTSRTRRSRGERKQ